MSAVFDAQFLKNLPSDPDEAETMFIDRLWPIAKKINTAGSPVERAAVNDLVEGMAVYLAWRRRFAWLQTVTLGAASDPQNSLNTVLNVLTAYRQENLERVARSQSEEAIKRGEEWFAMQSGELFCYEFSEPEIEEIQEHLNVLRELIAGATELKEEHKLRLFRRLDQLRSELNKKVSDLDRFWGLIGDVRIVVQKIKGDSDRVDKTLRRVWLIAKIVFAAQQIAHQLPPTDHQTHLLPPPPAAVIEDRPMPPAEKAPAQEKPTPKRKTTVV
jgi:hypothetical protein